MKKIYKKVVRQYFNMRALQKVILSHLNFKGNLNLTTRFSLITNGFHSDKSILYNFYNGPKILDTKKGDVKVGI